MENSIPEEILISKSDDSSKTILTINPRNIDGYDFFFAFLFIISLGLLIANLISNHFNIISIITGLIFLGLFGKLMIEMIISLNETQIITYDSYQIEIIRKWHKKRIQQFDKKSIKGVKLENMSLFGDNSRVYLSFKNIINLFGYQIPVIKRTDGDILIAEHHNENFRKWISNYLNKRL